MKIGDFIGRIEEAKGSNWWLPPVMIHKYKLDFTNLMDKLESGLKDGQIVYHIADEPKFDPKGLFRWVYDEKANGPFTVTKHSIKKPIKRTKLEYDVPRMAGAGGEKSAMLKAFKEGIKKGEFK